MDIDRASPEPGMLLRVFLLLTKRSCNLPVDPRTEHLVAGVHQMAVIVVDRKYRHLDRERAEEELATLGSNG